MVLADGTASSFRAEATVGPAAARRLLASWGYSPKTFDTLAIRGFKARSAGPVSLTRKHRVETIQSWNVVGLVPGHDAKLRDEVVVYTAHLDHIGVGDPDASGDSIYNGAHDNALGIGKLLATARGMVRLEPRRTILFMAAGAEERGLLGSWSYVRHPLFPVERTAAAINQDGGLEGPATDDLFAFGSDQTTLEGVLDDVAAKAGMRVNRAFKAPFSASQALLFRSDQYPFLLAGVPAIYLMDGFTIGGNEERGRADWDAYIKNVNHQQRDNFNEAWTFESPARMAAFALRLGYELANREQMAEMKSDAVMQRKRASPATPYFRMR
jgi:Zn-dependent M28 family amino/carboxypeptidase